MRVLITGGAGFIGSHLVDRYLADGADVIVVDDFSTGSAHNLAHHRTSNLTIVEGKVEDRAVLDQAFVRVDLVYHLAAAVGVFEILRRPLECLRTNLDATEAVFERATRDGVRTVFTSTSEVYGKNGKARLAETDDSIYGPTETLVLADEHADPALRAERVAGLLSDGAVVAVCRECLER